MSRRNIIVAVDARTVYDGNRRGIGRTVVELYLELAALRPKWKIVMFHQRAATDNPFEGVGNIVRKQIDAPGDRFNLWEEARLPVAAAMSGATVLHCPANTAPKFLFSPLVVTIHDLIPLETEPLSAEVQKWERRVRRAAQRASCVFTPSDYSKRQISERLGVSEQKLSVCRWAPFRECHRVEDVAELSRIREKYGVSQGKSYVIGFGASDPRKNTRRILEAWAGVSERIRQHRLLLLIGIQDSHLPIYREFTSHLGINTSCILYGFAAEKDLPALMSGAEVLCYPSLSEGFGLPVVDAFVAGVPVLTSDTTSLPEVAGDAAVIVDPANTEAIREGLESILGSDILRKELIRRGTKRLEEFSWTKCAETVVGAIEHASRP